MIIRPQLRYMIMKRFLITILLATPLYFFLLNLPRSSKQISVKLLTKKIDVPTKQLRMTLIIRIK